MSSDGVKNPQAVLLPFYVVVDVSWSMADEEAKDEEGNTPLDLANRIVPEVVDALRGHPTAADKVRIGLIDFSGEAKVVLPLTDARDISGADMPELAPRTTGTAFSSAFLTLRQTIAADAEQLHANDFEVHRPAVFFLTDGDPTEPEKDWTDAFALLTERNFNWHPNFIPYGFAEASRRVLDQLADYKTGRDSGKPRSFLWNDKSASKAVTGMIDTLVSSIIATGEELAANGAEGEFILAVAEAEEDDDD